ncbi:short transient receptor potential channel 4-like isoform X2 [Ptychodera flava]|uniref:short transient receptor potential channel 4-like isoform X2 n=1 Tax=Ptychodera flava TaxID=63121 RepID=UPI00396A0A5C
MNFSRQGGRHGFDFFSQRIFGEEEDIDKLYLTAAERGDTQTLEYALDTDSVDINCVDRKGRSALILALQNGHTEAMAFLLRQGVHVGDALLRAVDAQFYRGVQLLSEFSQSYKGRSINVINCRSENEDFHPDITPIILAAHHNNYDIIKMLLHYGATIEDPEKTTDRVTEKHTLQHSLGTLNVFQALASEAYISLVSTDPIDRAFKLSVKLIEMSVRDYEFRQEYLKLSEKCEQFAADLLGETRDTKELTTILTHDRASHRDIDLPHQVFKAVKMEQKRFVAHPHCQQLLIERWYHGLPNWRDKSMLKTIPISIAIGLSYPLLSIFYVFFPFGKLAKFINIPFVKFLLNTASYLTFLFLLLFSSDMGFIGSFGLDDLPSDPEERIDELTDQVIQNQQRGPSPNTLQYIIGVWLIGMTWVEMKDIFKSGCKAYLKNPYNILDFCQLALFWTWMALRITAMVMVNDERKVAAATNKRSLSLQEFYNLTEFIDDQHENLQKWNQEELNSIMIQIISNISSLVQSLQTTNDPDNKLTNLTGLLTEYIARTSNGNSGNDIDPSKYGYDDVSYSIPRGEWNQWDPTLLADAIFAVACVLSVLRLLRIIVISELVGPLQISLSKMNYDIMKFIFIFTFVWIAFGLGLSQVYWAYAASDEISCLQDDEGTVKECSYQPFGSLSWSMETLFFSLFGLLETDILRIKADHSSTEWFGTVLYGMYYIIAVVVLLNLLIAIMSNTYSKIEKNEDTEWKYHRSEMWVSFFEGDTIPPPFNIIPSPLSIWKLIKSLYYCIHWSAATKRNEEQRRKTFRKHEHYKGVVSQLVLRYFADKKSSNGRGGRADTISRAEFMDFKQDMSTFRYEQLGIGQKLERNASMTSSHLNSLVLRLVQMEKININLLKVLENDVMKQTKHQGEMIERLGTRLGQVNGEMQRQGNQIEILRRVIEQLGLREQVPPSPTLPPPPPPPPPPPSPPPVQIIQKRVRTEVEIQTNADEMSRALQTPVTKPTSNQNVVLPVLVEEPEMEEVDLLEDTDSTENAAMTVELPPQFELINIEQPGTVFAATDEDDNDDDGGDLGSHLSRYSFERVLPSSTPVPLLQRHFEGEEGKTESPWQRANRVRRTPRFKQHLKAFHSFEHSDDGGEGQE